MGKITKVKRFELHPIDNPKLVDHMLHDLQYESWKIGNMGIQMLWDINNANYSFKKKFNHYFELHDLGIKQKNVQGYIPFVLKKKFKKMNTSSLETEMRKVSKEWKNHRYNIFHGYESIINYKKNKSNIYVRATQIKIKPTDFGNKYTISFRLLNSPYAKELYNNGIKVKNKVIKRKTDSMWVYFFIKIKNKYDQKFIDNILDKTYKLGSSAILYNSHKNKWMINFSFTFSKSEVDVDPQKIMGIDLGWDIPAVIAINTNNKYKRLVGSRQEIEHFYHTLDSQKRRMQYQAKWCGNGRVGHGTKTRLKPAYRVRDKVGQFKKLKNHCWSKYVVEEAVRLGVGVIQMEDLGGITDSRKGLFLKRWNYFDLQQKIEDKANEYGIKVTKIKPQFTSARCNKCGYINGLKVGESKTGANGWRPDQATFHCLNCGYQENADVNAARNIAMKDIDSIIADQKKLQEKVNNKSKVLV